MSDDAKPSPGDPSPGEPSPGKQEAPRGPHDYLHVVGIGASAGGIDALKKFFSAVPSDTEAAFVVVMHLSPEHESHLKEVVEQDSPIPVTQVCERTEMQPGHVFVIPPNKNLEITDGHLIVTDFEEPRGQRAPIDVFFRTLAEVHPDGIGIVMSGSGTDGTVGMKAIKQHGGVLMVQLPDEARYDSMPTSAIDTGLIDFVLPAEQLAEKVEELAKDRHRAPIPFEIGQLDEDGEAALQKILMQLQARTGHDFIGYKRSTLCRRISRRMRVAQVDTLDDYLEYLRRNQGEALSLQKDFLISVTDFFRDPATFSAVAETVIPRIVEKYAKADDVRVWVPGCATGEEAYSLAILLREEAARHESPPRFQIFATDLDEDALAYARQGRYPGAISADVSDERLRRFFIREGSNYRVKSELREMILFASHNLLKDPPFSNLALVSCRNLLIYLKRDLQTKIYELFHYALEPEGFLFLGSSESADGASTLFRSIDKRNRLYQRKSNTSHSVLRLPDLPLRATKRKWVRTRRHAAEPQEPSPATDLGVHQRALQQHAPPSILVDQNHDIVHLSENAGRYLHVPGGSPTSNAVKLAKDRLRLELRTALQTIFDAEKATLSAPIMLDDASERAVRLYAGPAHSESEQPLALVLFIETEPTQLAHGLDEEADDDVDKRTQHLAREVERLRDQLQITAEKSETQQEELTATNEELQSINEEYKSTLEELETSKEELQSVNEELKTVNVELKEKVEQLSHVNNDLENLMDATDVATLFVDRHLQIKLYTPALEEVFNVRPLDEGRPLSHVTHRLDIDDLESKACEVLRTLIPYEQTVEGPEGKWYLMRILPYRTTEDRIDGVILTFVDITRVRQTRESLRRTQEHYELLIKSVDEYAIFTMDPEGFVVSWNPGAVRLFGYSNEEFLGEHGALVFTEEDRRKGIPDREMATALKTGQASDERWHVRKDGSRFWGRGTMNTLYDEDGKLRGFAKVLRDNTEKRDAEKALRRMNETLEEQVEQRTRQVRKLASDLTMAEQQERRRLSQILHDSLQQRLYGIQMKMTFVRDHAEDGERQELKGYADQAWEWIAKAIETTRQLSVDLSPPVLNGDGLTDALTWLKRQMSKMHNLEVDLEAERAFHIQDRDMLVLLFHLVRELLFNVVKHAQAERASVQLFEEDSHLVIRVIDDGVGFEVDEVSNERDSGGFGLFSVRERLDLFGGSLDIDTAPGEGTHVTIRVPIATGASGAPIGVDVGSQKDTQPAD